MAPSSTNTKQVDLHVNQIDLLKVWRFLNKFKATIIAITVMVTVIAACLSLLIQDRYTAETVLYPSSKNGSSNSSGLINQLGGFAGLAGISLNQEEDDVEKALAILSSRKFINAFVQRHEISKAIFLGRSGKTSEWDIYKEFSKFLTVNKDKRTGLIILSLEFVSAEQAKDWLNLLVKDLNSHMKKMDQDEALRSIDFLTARLEITSKMEMKKTFYQLIENQTKTLMIAESRTDYTFQVIDPAVAPERPSAPLRLPIILGSLIAGMIIGVFAAYVRFIFQQNVK